MAGGTRSSLEKKGQEEGRLVGWVEGREGTSKRGREGEEKDTSHGDEMSKRKRGKTGEGNKRGRHLFSTIEKQGFLINPIF